MSPNFLSIAQSKNAQSAEGKVHTESDSDDHLYYPWKQKNR